MLRILLTSTLLLANILCYSQNITVHISNIRNTKGVLRIALFQNEEQYENSKPAFSLYVSKAGISNGCTTAVFRSVDKGTYGIAVLDDENNNGEMDKKFFIPEEGFGFSNFDDFNLTKPAFDDFSFKTDGKQNIEVSVKIRYY